jgi:ring-1,2-phenylacetyl-CoA epoxidase subunit PaaD
MATMRDDLQRELLDAGFPDAEVRVSLTPAWTSDWITERGKTRHSRMPASPRPEPHRAPAGPGGADPHAHPPRRDLRAVRVGQREPVLRIRPTACKAMYQCLDCLEPFDHVKEI